MSAAARGATALVAMLAAISAPGAELPQERVQMLADGQCKVRTQKLDCIEVAGYLHDQLKLAPGHLIRVRAGQSVELRYQDVRALFDSLHQAGFLTFSAHRAP